MLKLPTVLQAGTLSNSAISVRNSLHDQEYINRKRKLEIEDQELQQSQKRMILQIQQAIVQNVLQNNFSKAEKLKQYLKTCLSSPNSRLNDLATNLEEDQDVKFILEKPSVARSLSFGSECGFSDDTVSAVSAFERPSSHLVGVSYLKEFINNRDDQLIVHIVTADDSIPVEDNRHVVVVYKAKKECGKYGSGFCKHVQQHFHYVLYIDTNRPLTKASYQIRLNRVLRSEFNPNLISRNKIFRTRDEMSLVIDQLERVHSV
jgi:hypothetical protein